MKLGDLVKFVAPPIFSSAILDYASSGIIIKVNKFEGTDRETYKVHWIDGNQSTEHFSYLEKLGKND